MVLVVLLIGSLAMLSFALVSMVNAANKGIKGARNDLNAVYVCEAGISEAVHELANGGDGVIGSEKNPRAYGPASYWVEAVDIGGGLTALTANGFENNAVARLELIVKGDGDENLYRWAAFGRDYMSMDSQAKVDSYDSSLGTYASQEVNGSGSKSWANANGDIGSNVDITMKQNTLVYGDAVPGPGHAVNLMGQAAVSGSTTPATTDIVLPPLDIPVIASSGNHVVSGSETLLGGDHAYDDLTVNGTLNIDGPATLLVDNLVLTSNSEIVIDPTGGPVEIYVLEDFDMNSNTLISSIASKPSDVAIYLNSDNIIDPDVDVSLDPAAIEFDSNSEIFGTIYAPNAHIEIDSNFQLYGSLVARSVDLDSNSRIHFDEDLLAGGGANNSSAFQTICWRLLPDSE